MRRENTSNANLAAVISQRIPPGPQKRGTGGAGVAENDLSEPGPPASVLMCRERERESCLVLWLVI